VRVGSFLHQPVHLRTGESHASMRSPSHRRLILAVYRQFVADSSEIHRRLIPLG
jgi:hypothetical protein